MSHTAFQPSKSARNLEKQPELHVENAWTLSSKHGQSCVPGLCCTPLRSPAWESSSSLLQPELQSRGARDGGLGSHPASRPQPKLQSAEPGPGAGLSLSRSAAARAAEPGLGAGLPPSRSAGWKLCPRTRNLSDSRVRLGHEHEARGC